MKPPVVHQPVQPPNPTDTDAAAAADAERHPRSTTPPGLVGSYGPLVGGPTAEDAEGAGADERKAP